MSKQFDTVIKHTFTIPPIQHPAILVIPLWYLHAFCMKTHCSWHLTVMGLFRTFKDLLGRYNCVLNTSACIFLISTAAVPCRQLRQRHATKVQVTGFGFEIHESGTCCERLWVAVLTSWTKGLFTFDMLLKVNLLVLNGYSLFHEVEMVIFSSLKTDLPAAFSQDPRERERVALESSQK